MRKNKELGVLMLTAAASHTTAIGSRHRRKSHTCWIRGRVGTSCEKSVRRLESAWYGSGEVLNDEMRVISVDE